jgi:hypothetical protein
MARDGVYKVRVRGAASSYELELAVSGWDLVLRAGRTRVAFPLRPGTTDPAALVELWRRQNAPDEPAATPDFDTFAWLLAVASEGPAALAETGLDLELFRPAIVRFARSRQAAKKKCIMIDLTH